MNNNNKNKGAFNTPPRTPVRVTPTNQRIPRRNSPPPVVRRTRARNNNNNNTRAFETPSPPRRINTTPPRARTPTPQRGYVNNNALRRFLNNIFRTPSSTKSTNTSYKKNNSGKK